jgi:hypothetical protein
MLHRTLAIVVLPLLLLPAALTKAQQNADTSAIGYPTVAAALEALRAKRGVKISTQAGWTVIEDPTEGIVVWSFTPSGHYAHPSVSKRTMLQRNGDWHVETRVLCGSQKPACDKLMVEYAELDARMREAIARGRR